MQLSKQDYEALAAFRNTLRRFLHFSEEAARTMGLTPQQHQLLLAIKGQVGRDWASVSELAEALQIKHHALVGLVNRCQTAGCVYREADETDRRVVHVCLTAKGEGLLSRLSAQHVRELSKLREALKDLAAFN